MFGSFPDELLEQFKQDYHDYRMVSTSPGMTIDVECDTSLPISTPAELMEQKLRKRTATAMKRAERAQKKESRQKEKEAKRRTRDLKRTQGTSFSEAQEDSFDFARCQRSDGSYYGTGGTCRKGSQVSDAEVLKLKSSLEKQIGEAAKSGDMEKTNNLMKALAAVTDKARERGLAESSQNTAKKAWLTEKAKEFQDMATKASNDGWRDRAIMYSKKAAELLQEKADLDKD